MRGRRVFSTVALALALSLVSAANAAAYTIDDNNFGIDPTQPGTPNGCTNRYDPATNHTYWCWRWPMTANYNSTYVNVYLDPSLSQNLADQNLVLTAQAAFVTWNKVPASSPYLLQVGTIRAATGYNLNAPTEIYRSYSVTYPVIGLTWSYSIWDLTGGQGDPNTRVSFHIAIAGWPHLVAHKSSYSYSEVDGDWVMSHELGHALGLGHTGMSTVMYPIWSAAHDVITPTTGGGGDVAGLQFLYNRNFCLTCQH